MRRYTVTVNGQDHTVEIDDDVVSVNGKEVQAAIASVEDAMPATSSAGIAEPSTTAVAAGEGPCDVKAPLPGVVLEIHVKQGDRVGRGDIIAIIEAMKMRNEIRATQAGTVASINVTTGDNVVYGQLLAHLEG